MDLYTELRRKHYYTCNNKTIMFMITFLILILGTVPIHFCIVLFRDVNFIRTQPYLRSDDNDMHRPTIGNIPKLRSDDNDINRTTTGSLSKLRRDDNDINRPTTGSISKQRRDDNDINRTTTGSLSKRRSDDYDINRTTTGSLSKRRSNDNDINRTATESISKQRRDDNDINRTTTGSLSKLRRYDNDINRKATESLSRLKLDDNYMNNPLTGSKQVNDFQLTIDRNSDRKKHLQEQCRTIRQTSSRKDRSRHEFFSKDNVRILTNPDLTLAYCRVNKAASWYTVHTLGKLFNCSEECLHRSSESVRRLTYERKKTAIDGAYKFMFVREPYGRLFSTYCNKFYFPKGYWGQMGKDIVRKFRKNPSEDSLRFGHDVTFAELIRYTIADFEAGHKMDAHIRPMHTNCKPCDYDYDFIGKLETIKSDWKYLAHEWKSRNVTKNIPPDIGEKPKDVFSEIIHFHSTLHKVKRSKIQLFDLYKRAWNYFQITSVISKHINMPFARFGNKTFGYYSFLYQLKRARERSTANAKKLEGQRHEAMLQAYSTIPMEDLERLKNVVKEDCLLFGYDNSPDWLFGRNASHNKLSAFNYFSGLT